MKYHRFKSNSSRGSTHVKEAIPAVMNDICVESALGILESKSMIIASAKPTAPRSPPQIRTRASRHVKPYPILDSNGYANKTIAKRINVSNIYNNANQKKSSNVTLPSITSTVEACTNTSMNSSSNNITPVVKF